MTQRHGIDPKLDLKRRIAAALKEESADRVVKGGRVLDLVTGAMLDADVAIIGDRIVAVGPDYTGQEIIDARGQVIVPGFIDAHVHGESSHVAPLEFDRCIVPRGTTTAICDPHEIANVLGADGIRYFLDSALHTALDLRVQMSSCVPASELETAGARLEAAELLALADHPKALGLAEFMSFESLFAREESALDKLVAFRDRVIDGHAPLVTGARLNAYLAAGIANCHESTSVEEGREKLQHGMRLFLREGSVSKDVAALAPLLNEMTSAFCGFCTDDRNPLDIAEEGHIDHAIRLAIRHGAPPAAAYRAASWSVADAFGLSDRGLVAPGRRADLVLLDDYESCTVGQVILGGRPVSDAIFGERDAVAPVGLTSVKRPPVDENDFRIPANGGGERPVIGVTAGRILTDHLRLSVPERDGWAVADVGSDILKVAVLHRHGHNANIGHGFVRGFGLRRGALASSVGHDSHNICVVGTSDRDMRVAVNRLIELQGGFVAADDGAVLAELALPIAGLMSPEPFESVRQRLEHLRAAVRALGCPLPEPFLQLAFLPLPVIPHLKITDLGMVDVDTFRLIDG